MLRILTLTLFSTNLLFSLAAQAATLDAKSAPPEVLTKRYGCPPYKDKEQCKVKAQEEFVSCIALVDTDEQELEDSLGNQALPHPTQRVCEDEREKRMNECEQNCK
jgi:hypothetical protein